MTLDVLCYFNSANDMRANDICSSIVLLQIIISCQDQNKTVLNIPNTSL